MSLDRDNWNTQMDEISIDFPQTFDGVIKIQMSRKRWPVGYVKLIRRNNAVTIADIYIYDHSRCIFQFLPWFKVGTNFRRRGLGSKLLVNVIEFCRNNGVQEIEGTAIGDINFLIPWYRKHGFSIDAKNKIVLKLK